MNKQQKMARDVEKMIKAMKRDMERNQKNVTKMMSIYGATKMDETPTLFEIKEKQVEENIRINNGYADKIFLSIFTEDACWANAEEESVRTDKVFPRILCMEKWNGLKGFIGGSVRSDESLLKGLCREVKEECGYVLDDQQVHDGLQLLQVNVLEGKKYNIYNFSLHLDRESVSELITCHTNGRDYNGEIVGYSLQQIHEGNKLLKESLKGAFHGTGWKEFIALTEKIWKKDDK